MNLAVPYCLQPVHLGPHILRRKAKWTTNLGGKNDNEDDKFSAISDRVQQLESLVSELISERAGLRREIKKLKESSASFMEIVEMLRRAGLDTAAGDEIERVEISVLEPEDLEVVNNGSGDGSSFNSPPIDPYTSVFGSAPSSVVDAADAAGTSILSALLAGSYRMLVDVRDSELTSSSELLAQFVELSILPVAAGLEGLNAEKNRLKLVFPTVSELSNFRKYFCLSSPDVIALGTLGFGSTETNDALVVIIAPRHDTAEFQTMLEVVESIERPVVIINCHMDGHIAQSSFPDKWNLNVVYHLRLLNVQYLAEQKSDKDRGKGMGSKKSKKSKKNDDGDLNADATTEPPPPPPEYTIELSPQATRAMVIRSYPRPWHVFVDVAPKREEADFEVAATFDVQPSKDDVYKAIVECLEGSEEEEMLVLKEMEEMTERQTKKKNKKKKMVEEEAKEEEEEEEEGNSNNA